MKHTLHLFQTVTILTAGVLLARPAAAQTETWTGAGTDQNWSTLGNWTAGALAVPGAATNVLFTNNVTAPTSAGTVDSIVDGSFGGSIATLQFANTNNNTGAGFFHTAQIGAGQTLQVLGNLTVGFTPDVPNSQINAAFTGAGTLMISNATAGLNVSQGDNGNLCSATLNLTNLNTFQATIGGITVGVYNTPNPAVARQKGFLYLAKTNIINLVGNAPHAYGNEGQIEIGENLGNGSNAQVPMYLGIMNTVNVNSITVGGDKQGSGALLAFNPVFTNLAPLAVFRGTNGPASRVSLWKIGDNSNQTTSGSGCAGTADFSNGLLDALVDTMIIGEGESGASSGTGNGTGTFTFNTGTNNVNTLYLGYRVATGGNSAPPGTMNVNGTATLLVNNAICLSFYQPNSGSTYASGNLNINGGTVLANNITNGVPAAANLNANVTMTGGLLGLTSLAGNIGTPDAPILNLSLNDSTLQLPVSGFHTNVETITLSLAGATNLINFSYLPPISGYPVTNALIGFQSLLGTMNLGVGSFPSANPPYQGYITNDATAVYLVLTGGPTLGSTLDVWRGQNGNNWDLTTINWTSFGNPTTFANGAPVQFDDSASNSVVDLATALLPASVTVSNNSLSYAFGGSGKISGSGGLTKYGAGTLLVTNGGANDFLGSVTINAGTIQFGNGGAGGILPPAGNVLANGALAFNRSGAVTVPNLISGTGTLVQNGSSVLTLTASNDFTGAAVVNAGTLLLNGVLSGTLSNAVGTTLGGAGTNAGPVSLGGLLQPSAALGTPATFTSGTLTLFSGSTLAFALSGTDTTSGNGINDLLDVGGDLNLNNNTIALNFQGVPQTGLPYTLINFSGSQNGAFSSALAGTHFASTLSQGVSPVTVTLNGSGATLKWDATANNLWNVGGNANWLNLGSSSPDVFYQGDMVLFDDSVAGVTNNISIPAGASVSPAVISNNSSSVNYTIAGPGQISGNVNLLKQGASTLTIASPNAGFTGTATVQGGILRAGSGAAFGLTTPGTVVATNGGTLDLNGAGLGQVTVIASGVGVNGNGAIVNSGADQIHAVNIVKLSGDAVFGGTGRWDIRINGIINASLGSADGNTHNIVKKGSNLVALVTCAIDPTIGDIDIQQGSFSLQLAGTAQNSGAWFADNSHSITVESGGNLGFNSLGAASPLYRTIVLNDGSTFSSSAGDSSVGGDVILHGNVTVNVSGGSSPWLLLRGTISGAGNLIVNGAFPLQLSGTNTYTGNTLINAGQLNLIQDSSGVDGSIAASPNIIIAAGAVLDTTLRSDQTLTLAPGQTLQGDGAVNGLLVVGPGATLSAGTNTSHTGALTVSNNVTLLGNTLMKLNRAAGTNDVLDVVGLNLTYGGILTLTNLSAAPLQAGDAFPLFSAASYSGAFTAIAPATPGVGLAWNTNNLAVNGVLSVVSTLLPQPHITAVTLSGSNLVLSGTNGLPNASFNLLESTNVALPLANWTPAATNEFDASGNFNVTNPVDPHTPRLFYLLRIPTP